MFLRFTAPAGTPPKGRLRTAALAAAFALPALVAGAFAGPAAAEINLAMFEEHGCVWCEKWNKEIGPIYHKTDEGKIAPLVRYDVHSTDYSQFELKSRPYFTPTFILMEDGKELSRIEGYPGEDFFWALLGMMIDKLPDEKKQIPPEATTEAAADTDAGAEGAPGAATTANAVGTVEVAPEG